MNPAVSSMGPSARAVMTQHTAAVARHRRWTIGVRVVTGALIVAAVLPFAVMFLDVRGASTASVLDFVPSGLLIPWLLWKTEILTLLGRPGYPHFPAEMLRLAETSDHRAANLQPFGSVPPDPRLSPRDW